MPDAQEMTTDHAAEESRTDSRIAPALSPQLTWLRIRFAALRARAAADDGLTTLEVAIIAAGLLAVAVALVAIITTAVGNHDATIK